MRMPALPQSKVESKKMKGSLFHSIRSFFKKFGRKQKSFRLPPRE